MNVTRPPIREYRSLYRNAHTRTVTIASLSVILVITMLLQLPIVGTENGVSIFIGISRIVVGWIAALAFVFLLDAIFDLIVLHRRSRSTNGAP